MRASGDYSACPEDCKFNHPLQRTLDWASIIENLDISCELWSKDSGDWAEVILHFMVGDILCGEMGAEPGALLAERLGLKLRNSQHLDARLSAAMDAAGRKKIVTSVATMATKLYPSVVFFEPNAAETIKKGSNKGQTIHKLRIRIDMEALKRLRLSTQTSPLHAAAPSGGRALQMVSASDSKNTNPLHLAAISTLWPASSRHPSIRLLHHIGVLLITGLDRPPFCLGVTRLVAALDRSISQELQAVWQQHTRSPGFTLTGFLAGPFGPPEAPVTFPGCFSVHHADQPDVEQCGAVELHVRQVYELAGMSAGQSPPGRTAGPRWSLRHAPALGAPPPRSGPWGGAVLPHRTSAPSGSLEPSWDPPPAAHGWRGVPAIPRVASVPLETSRLPDAGAKSGFWSSTVFALLGDVWPSESATPMVVLMHFVACSAMLHNDQYLHSSVGCIALADLAEVLHQATRWHRSLARAMSCVSPVYGSFNRLLKIAASTYPGCLSVSPEWEVRLDMNGVMALARDEFADMLPGHTAWSGARPPLPQPPPQLPGGFIGGQDWYGASPHVGYSRDSSGTMSGSLGDEQQQQQQQQQPPPPPPPPPPSLRAPGPQEHLGSFPGGQELSRGGGRRLLSQQHWDDLHSLETPTGAVLVPALDAEGRTMYCEVPPSQVMELQSLMAASTSSGQPGRPGPSHQPRLGEEAATPPGMQAFSFGADARFPPHVTPRPGGLDPPEDARGYGGQQQQQQQQHYGRPPPERGGRWS